MKHKRKGARPKKPDRLAANLAECRDGLANAAARDRENNFSEWPFKDREILCQMWAMPSPPLSEAAEFFGLDLKSDTERGALLGILAAVVFNKPKKGRPSQHKRKWDTSTLIQLAVDCNNVKANTPEISDKKAAAEIKNRNPARYKHNSAEMIRQQLKSARIWLENENRLRADHNLEPITLALVQPLFSAPTVE
jgi:hypothetical protein